MNVEDTEHTEDTERGTLGEEDKMKDGKVYSLQYTLTCVK